MKKAKIKKILPDIILAIVFIIGLLIFLYPSISNILNTWARNKDISQYNQKIAELSTEEYEKMINDAKDFNNSLLEHNLAYNSEMIKKTNYKQLLSVGISDIIGYLSIDKINVKLPIYHGTDATTLQYGIGHLEGSSLPVEGESVHCILSGHTGLPSAKLLSNLVELKVGDTFRINVLNKRYIYKVDQILVVEPNETEGLEIVEGKQYITLVTCTPYGINTHRLLVRGERLPDVQECEVENDAIVIDSNIVVAILSTVLITLLFIIMINIRRKKEKKEEENSNNEK